MGKLVVVVMSGAAPPAPPPAANGALYETAAKAEGPYAAAESKAQDAHICIKAAAEAELTKAYAASKSQGILLSSFRCSFGYRRTQDPDATEIYLAKRNSGKLTSSGL